MLQKNWSPEEIRKEFQAQKGKQFDLESDRIIPPKLRFVPKYIEGLPGRKLGTPASRTLQIGFTDEINMVKKKFYFFFEKRLTLWYTVHVFNFQEDIVFEKRNTDKDSGGYKTNRLQFLVLIENKFSSNANPPLPSLKGRGE